MRTEAKKYTLISDGHSMVWNNKVQGYSILGGNNHLAYNITDKANLKEVWTNYLKTFGYSMDVSLYFNNKLIRSVRNYAEPLLNKSIQYRCTYSKYNNGIKTHETK